MHARLDPGCEGAQQLDKAHRSQRRLMLEGASQGRLATVVETTQEQQVEAHRAACARCRTYSPVCPECGFDPRKARHGWRCSVAGAGWSEWLPWNWRARRAPAPAAPPRKNAPSAARTVPVREGPASPPPARRQASAPEPRKASPYAVLGVGASASEAEVRKAYRERAQQYHPDKVAHMAPEFREVAERRMKEINEAYESIKRTWT